jgi:hypothetical protein
MSAERETTRIVRSWLRVDERESANRVLQIVLAGLDAAPQRRSWWPAWRLHQMRPVLSLGFVAAAAILVIVVGVALPAISSRSIGPSPSHDSAQAPVLPADGAIGAGTYRMNWPDAEINVTLPPGWWATDGGAGIARNPRQDQEPVLLMRLHAVTQVDTDVCTMSSPLVDIGPTAADLTAALVAQRGRASSGPSTVMIAGYPARRFVLVVSGNCPGPDGKRVWVDDPDRFVPPSTQLAWNSPGFYLLPGGTGTVYVVDVDGKRVVITTLDQGSPAEDVVELEAILASMTIRP